MNGVSYCPCPFLHRSIKWLWHLLLINSVDHVNSKEVETLITSGSDVADGWSGDQKILTRHPQNSANPILDPKKGWDCIMDSLVTVVELQRAWKETRIAKILGNVGGGVAGGGGCGRVTVQGSCRPWDPHSVILSFIERKNDAGHRNQRQQINRFIQFSSITKIKWMVMAFFSAVQTMQEIDHPLDS